MESEQHLHLTHPMVLNHISFFVITRESKNPLSPLDGANWDKDVLELERERKPSSSQLFQRRDIHVVKKLVETHSRGSSHNGCQSRRKIPFLRLKWSQLQRTSGIQELWFTLLQPGCKDSLFTAGLGPWSSAHQCAPSAWFAA